MNKVETSDIEPFEPLVPECIGCQVAADALTEIQDFILDLLTPDQIIAYKKFCRQMYEKACLGEQ